MRYIYTEEEEAIMNKIKPYLVYKFGPPQGKFFYKKGTPPELIKEWEESVQIRRKKIHDFMTMPITYGNKAEK